MECAGVQRKRYLLCIHCDPAKYCDDIENLKQHWLRIHRDVVFLRCGQCKTPFRHQTSLVRHIRGRHINMSQELHSDDDEEDDGDEMENTPGTSENNERVQQNNSVAGSVNNFAENFSESEEETCSGVEHEQIDLKTEAAKHLLNLRSAGNLTNATIELIQKFTSELISLVALQLRRKTENFLKENQVDEIICETFILETFQIDDLFQGLNTTDKQLDYFSDKYGLVIPEEMYLSSRIEHRLDRSSRMFLPKQVSQTFQSVSLIQTLTLIARNKYLREMILCEKESTDGVYRGYKDGSDFKKNPFLQKFPFAFRIELNYDDLETANGLGIQNLPVEENSKLSSIFLLAMAFSEDLKDKGVFQKILTPFLEDLKRLQSDEGVEITLPDGGLFILRACLVCFCADSLAAHALLGFMSPSASWWKLLLTG
ncbi:Protein indeterminate-domain 6, chloroplastic [Frankliniella fusca]|uniref:Protein indeterminate-domain 6, chloroplastic n=1 Tax=Frankliniella fusca TaxID=407009 RepID=A0AAE1HFT5_9NEOP|nr:Protein indeterminate-domain 6, chloroplastic [Frankliniella fusca]